MTISVRVDPASNSALYVVGDEFLLDVRWVDKNGEILAIDDTAEYQATITRAGVEQPIASVAHELVGQPDEPTARFSFPLSIASDLAEARGVYVTIRQVLSAGPPIRAVSLFTFNLPVRQLAGTLAPVGGLAPDLSAPTLIEVGPNGVFISPRGPSGASAAQQLAGALDPDADPPAPYIPEPTVAAMAEWLRAAAGDSAEGAIEDCEAAAAYARGEGDYAKAQGDYVVGLVGAALLPEAGFMTALKSIVDDATGPVFVRPVPGVYRWNGATTPGSGAMLDLNPKHPVGIDWSGTKWEVHWDVRDPDDTIRPEIDHFGGPAVHHRNIDRELVPSPFAQGVVQSSTATSLTIRYDPGFAPVFFDAAYAQSRTADRITVKDRQFDEDGAGSVISPVRALGTRLVAGSDNGQVKYSAIDADGDPAPHGLAAGAAITILGERGYFGDDRLSGVNGEGRFTADLVDDSTFKLRQPDGANLTGGGLGPPVAGVANPDGTWDGPVLSDGCFVYHGRLVVNALVAVTPGSPIVLTLAPDATPGNLAAQPDGGYVRLSGTGLIDASGVELDGLELVIRSVKTGDGDSIEGEWELYTDDGDAPVALDDTSSWTGAGAVTSVVFPGTMSAPGTPVVVSCRKTGRGGLAFLGTAVAEVTGRSRSSVGVLLTGIGNEEFHVDLLSAGRPGALLASGSGTVILNDTRRLIRIKHLEVNGGADDVLNVVYKWWRPLQWPRQSGGADYIVGDFAVANTRTARPAPPRSGDVARVYDPAGRPVATCPVVAYSAITKRVDFAPGSLPVGFDPDAGWSIRPYSAIARWNVERVQSFGVGARCVVVTGAYPIIGTVVAVGNRKYAIRANNPASGAHATNGSFDGGLRIGYLLVTDGMVQKSSSTCAIQMRRFNPLTREAAEPRSDYEQSWIGNARFERLGYAMGNVNWDLRIDALSYRKVGYLRTPSTSGAAGADWTVEQATLSIGQVAGDRPLKIARGDGGQVRVETRDWRTQTWPTDAGATVDLAGVNVFRLGAALSADRTFVLDIGSASPGDRLAFLYDVAAANSPGQAVVIDGGTGLQLAGLSNGDRATLVVNDDATGLFVESVGLIRGVTLGNRSGFSFAAGVLPAGATVAHPDPLSLFDAAGEVQQVAAGQPAFERQWNGSTQSMDVAGLSLPPATTNLCPWSDDLTSWGAIGAQAAHPSALVEDHSTGLHERSIALLNFTAGNNWIQAIVGPITGPGRLVGLGVQGSIFGGPSGVVFDLATGLTGLSGTASSPYRMPLGDGRYLLGFKAPASGSGGGTVRVRTETTLAGGFGQMFAGNGETSVPIEAVGAFPGASGPLPPVPTAGAPVARNAVTARLDWTSQAVADGSYTMRYRLGDGTIVDDPNTPVVDGVSIVPAFAAGYILNDVRKL